MNNLTPKQLPAPSQDQRHMPDEMAWYIPAWRPGYYLHRDGVVRQHIFHHGQRLGYYATEAEALAVIAKFQASQEATK